MLSHIASVLSVLLEGVSKLLL